MSDNFSGKKIVISKVQRIEDNRPVRNETSWGAFVELCRNPEVRGSLSLEQYLASSKEVRDKQKNGPGIICGAFNKPYTRRGADLESLYLIPLDLDDGFFTWEGLTSSLEGIECVVVTTYSHSDRKGKFRIYALLESAIIKDIVGTLGRIIDYFESILGRHIDDKCRVPNQVFYAPSCPGSAFELFRFQHLHGEPLYTANFDVTIPNIDEIQTRTVQTPERNLPGDDYNKRGSWTQLLEPAGWTFFKSRGDMVYWTRPGKKGSISGVQGIYGTNLFYCHSTAPEVSPLKGGECYSLFAAYAILRHDGNFSDAARSLAEQGYGEQELLTVLAGGQDKNIKTIEWPDPLPLPERLPQVKSLDAEMIPVPFRDWLMDIADRMQIPPDFSVAAATVSIGSIIGRGCGIYPKRHDEWLVTPNLWGAAVGRPSLMKTPAISVAQKPLFRLESEAREAFMIAAAEFDRNAEFDKITRQAYAEELKRALKRCDTTAIGTARDKLDGLKFEEPKRRRFQTQDSTTEKIGELLVHNPRGLLVNRDELIGWFRALDRDGREGDRAFYLEAWNGNRAFTYDRIGRGTIDIPALCVSVFGAMTPGPLTTYVYQATRGGIGDDGLLQRFQVLVWPDTPREWKNVDRIPDTREKSRVYEIFKSLSGDIPGTHKEESSEIPALRFSPGGQEVFDSWRYELETRLRGDNGLPPALESHLTKYRSLMPSLALIFHLVDVVDGAAHGAVSESAAVRAAVWCDYLESHARRLYCGAALPEMEAAREIIKHYRKREIKDGATVRDIWRHGWARLASPEEVRAGLGVLSEFGWVFVEKIPTGGRPTEVVRFNPKLEVS